MTKPLRLYHVLLFAISLICAAAPSFVQTAYAQQEAADTFLPSVHRSIPPLPVDTPPAPWNINASDILIREREIPKYSYEFLLDEPTLLTNDLRLLGVANGHLTYFAIREKDITKGPFAIESEALVFTNAQQAASYFATKRDELKQTRDSRILVEEEAKIAISVLGRDQPSYTYLRITAYAIQDNVVLRNYFVLNTASNWGNPYAYIIYIDKMLEKIPSAPRNEIDGNDDEDNDKEEDDKEEDEEDGDDDEQNNKAPQSLNPPVTDSLHLDADPRNLVIYAQDLRNNDYEVTQNEQVQITDDLKSIGVTKGYITYMVTEESNIFRGPFIVGSYALVFGNDQQAKLYFDALGKSLEKNRVNFQDIGTNSARIVYISIEHRQGYRFQNSSAIGREGNILVYTYTYDQSGWLARPPVTYINWMLKKLIHGETGAKAMAAMQATAVVIEDTVISVPYPSETFGVIIP